MHGKAAQAMLHQDRLEEGEVDGHLFEVLLQPQHWFRPAVWSSPEHSPAHGHVGHCSADSRLMTRMQMVRLAVAAVTKALERTVEESLEGQPSQLQSL